MVEYVRKNGAKVRSKRQASSKYSLAVIFYLLRTYRYFLFFVVKYVRKNGVKDQLNVRLHGRVRVIDLSAVSSKWYVVSGK